MRQELKRYYLQALLPSIDIDRSASSTADATVDAVDTGAVAMDVDASSPATQPGVAAVSRKRPRSPSSAAAALSNIVPELPPTLRSLYEHFGEALLPYVQVCSNYHDLNWDVCRFSSLCSSTIVYSTSVSRMCL